MFIRTRRLFLRPAWREDSAALDRLLNDEAIQRELTGSPWLESLGDPDMFADGTNAADQHRLLIFRRAQGQPQLIGATGIGRSIARNEFGLWLARGARGQGFAQEAGNAMLSLAFEGLKMPSLWTPAIRSGEASQFIARLGFYLESKDATAALQHFTDWRSSSFQIAA